MEDKKLKILIVDDNNNIRNTYSEIFKKEGFEVSEAIDGLEGLDKATKDAPDIIFTGIIMPRMSGFELMEALKKNVSTSNIPVVISSHLGRQEDKEKANELGAKDFIVRDFYTPYEVAEKIKAVLILSEYKLKFSPDELDARKLAKDMHLADNFKCPDCRKNLILSIKFSDIKNHVFTGLFICPECGKTQK